MESRHAKRVGSIVGGKWVLQRLLGSGSTSAVYEATPTMPTTMDDNDERVAIKILHPHLCRDEIVVKRYLREAYVSNTIRHRSLVRVREDGVCENSVYLVLDLLEGETLEDRRLREGGRLALDTIAPLCLEVMSAVSAVHSVGVVHRDLKPQNVLLTTAGELKLLDFGTARVFDVEGETPVSIEGLVIGTPSFMSPEQARGERARIDAQSDIWSLGATLFTILSGEYVHVGRGAHQRLLAAASRPPRSLHSVAPWLDLRVVAVVDRALSFKKEDRYADIASMKIALLKALSSMEAAILSEPPPPSSDAAPPA
jgi:serine/threonine protein kinase